MSRSKASLTNRSARCAIWRAKADLFFRPSQSGHSPSSKASPSASWIHRILYSGPTTWLELAHGPAQQFDSRSATGSRRSLWSDLSPLGRQVGHQNEAGLLQQINYFGRAADPCRSPGRFPRNIKINPQEHLLPFTSTSATLSFNLQLTVLGLIFIGNHYSTTKATFKRNMRGEK